MHRYIPNGGEAKKEMLSDLGISSIDDLFRDIPKSLRFQGDLNIEDALSEMELLDKMQGLGSRNKPLSHYINFLGAGVYDHFRPLIIDHIISRSEFYTSYTPYQPEIAQGTLQAIFEYQSLISELTGMDSSNASMYDGANAAAEAVLLSLNASKNKRVLISEAIHPEIKRVVNTYLSFRESELVEVPLKNGKTDLEKAKELLEGGAAGFILQNPNFYGELEDIEAFVEVCGGKTLSIEIVDPISLGLLEAPGKLGVDIVVGDGQALGNGINLGGPYLGFMAVTKKLVRKLPGRVVGLTRDNRGQRAYVLTLQAREQHIRREKATSNICSNQSLNALSAAIYLSTMGKHGLREVALQSHSKARYLHDALIATGAFEEVYTSPFFKEFVLQYKGDVKELLQKLEEENILGGLALEGDKLLIAVTEKRTKKEMDAYVEAVKKVMK